MDPAGDAMCAARAACRLLRLADAIATLCSLCLDSWRAAVRSSVQQLPVRALGG